jgi:putative ABC transport system permease protein
MAAVNLLFVTRAGAVDARRVLAVARTVGVTPTTAALAFALGQLLPAVVGLALGGTVGVALFHVLSSSHPTTPSAAQFATLALLTLLATAALTAVPARLEARRPIAETLREE